MKKTIFVLAMCVMSAISCRAEVTSKDFITGDLTQYSFVSDQEINSATSKVGQSLSFHRVEWVFLGKTVIFGAKATGTITAVTKAGRRWGRSGTVDFQITSVTGNIIPDATGIAGKEIPVNWNFQLGKPNVLMNTFLGCGTVGCCFGFISLLATPGNGSSTDGLNVIPACAVFVSTWVYGFFDKGKDVVDKAGTEYNFSSGQMKVTSIQTITP